MKFRGPPALSDRPEGLRQPDCVGSTCNIDFGIDLLGYLDWLCFFDCLKSKALSRFVLALFCKRLSNLKDLMALNWV
jgi:hypothetical protein